MNNIDGQTDRQADRQTKYIIQNNTKYCTKYINTKTCKYTNKWSTWNNVVLNLVKEEKSTIGGRLFYTIATCSRKTFLNITAAVIDFDFKVITKP